MDTYITAAFNRDYGSKQKQGEHEKVKTTVEILCELHGAVEHVPGKEDANDATVLNYSAWHEWFNRKIFSFTIQSPTHIKSGVVVIEDSQVPLIIYLLDKSASRRWGDFFGSYCTIGPTTYANNVLKCVWVYTRREHADTHQYDDFVQSWGSGETVLFNKRSIEASDGLHTFKDCSFVSRQAINKPYICV